MSDSGAGGAASGGIGLLGMLIILGLLGIGPCAHSCRDCGPTPASIYRNLQTEAKEGR